MSDMKKEITSVLFMDVKGYSKLTESQLRRFFAKVLPDIANEVGKVKARHVNTWGDAVVVVSADTLGLASLALRIRDYFMNRNWSDLELPRLATRISLHTGVVFFGTDPFRDVEGIVGTQITLAARIEPVTIPNQAWATDNFVSLLSQEQQDNLAWDNLGERQLAKDWGAKSLFRLRYRHESDELPTFEEEAKDISVENRVRRNIELCTRLLSMGTDTQKLAALDNLAKIPHPDAARILLSYALKRDESERARRMAIASLVEMKSQASVPDLLQILGSPDESNGVIHAAVIALGQLGDRRAFDSLAKIAMSDESAVSDHHIRGAAMQAISRLEGRRAAAIINQILEKAEPIMIDAAIGAAGLAQSKILSPALADIASKKDIFDPQQRGSALEAILLAGTGPVQSILPSVGELAEDAGESPRVRVPAIGLLALYETPDARLHLERIAGRLDDDLSPLALKALLGGEDFAKEQIDDYKKRLGLTS